MKRWRIKAEDRARYILALMAGVALAFAFPRFSIAGLAWVAPGALLFAAAGTSGRIAFKVGFVGGFAFYLATLYWLLHIPMPILPIFGWLALSAYCALYVACWVWLCWKLYPVPEAKVPWERPVRDGILAHHWHRRVFWTIQCAALWVALEMILGRFLSGFPWEFLAVSQYRMLPLIQIASVTGIYGVSFIVAWFSVSLMLAMIAMSRTPQIRSLWVREMALPLLALSLNVAHGVRLLWMTHGTAPRNTVAVALIQPSIPQTLIWDEKENANRFRQLMELSEEALTNKPTILLWPEASVPNMLRHSPETADAVIDLVRKHGVWAILGSDDAEYREGSLERRIDYFNSAFAVSPQGRLEGRYIKRQLVIFGEYMPFAEWLPFLRKISPAGEAGFTAGKEPAPFHLRDAGVTTSVLICFEDTFPHLVRQYVHADTDFLINLTNNGWFGESAAQWQHAATAAFRAVENRVPLVRCANNGLTCWVDEAGAMHGVQFPEGGDIYKKGFKIAQIPVLSPGEERKLSFYTRYGDVFGWICVALATGSLAAKAIVNKGRTTHEQV